MKIVVTGCRGHLGQAVVRELGARGHTVIGLGSSQADLGSDSCIPVLAAALEGAGAIAHLAAWHPPATAATTAEDRRRLIDVNALGTLRVLEAAASSRAVVLYASSFEVYGPPESMPIDEEHPTRPLSDYGATKLAGEDHALAFAAETDRRVACLRMPAIYGPGETTRRILPNCLERVAMGQRPIIHGDGGDLRDQLYVDDAARAVALAIESPRAAGIYNIADGEPHSVAEIARTAMELAGLAGEPETAPRQKPRLDFHMSVARAARDFGFRASVPLREGMRRQLAWRLGRV